MVVIWWLCIVLRKFALDFISLHSLFVNHFLLAYNCYTPSNDLLLHQAPAPPQSYGPNRTQITYRNGALSTPYNGSGQAP